MSVREDIRDLPLARRLEVASKVPGMSISLGSADLREIIWALEFRDYRLPLALIEMQNRARRGADSLERSRDTLCVAIFAILGVDAMEGTVAALVAATASLWGGS